MLFVHGFYYSMYSPNLQDKNVLAFKTFTVTYYGHEQRTTTLATTEEARVIVALFGRYNAGTFFDSQFNECVRNKCNPLDVLAIRA